jgi:hypothetical protein
VQPNEVRRVRVAVLSHMLDIAMTDVIAPSALED